MHEFKKHYVGEDLAELCRFIFSSTTTALTSIRASFVHSRTKNSITISPDEIFKQMTDYIVLLLDDASTWMFSLAETYYRALTSAMQTDMSQNYFSMPTSVRNSLKSEQMKALNLVRSHATRSHERSYLSNRSIKQQVEATLGNVNNSTATAYKYAASNDNPAGYETFTANPMMTTLNEDEINIFSYDGQTMVDVGASTSVHNYKSQAEQTMYNYRGSQIQEHDVRNGLSPEFVQKFETKNGKKYPRHPDHPHYASGFPSVHNGCYYCSEDHEFRYCSRRE